MPGTEQVLLIWAHWLKTFARISETCCDHVMICALLDLLTQWSHIPSQNRPPGVNFTAGDAWKPLLAMS